MMNHLSKTDQFLWVIIKVYYLLDDKVVILYYLILNHVLISFRHKYILQYINLAKQI